MGLLFKTMVIKAAKIPSGLGDVMFGPNISCVAIVALCSLKEIMKIGHLWEMGNIAHCIHSDFSK